jgi:glycosyltransferase involved in cell wall biosynthesis
MGFAGRDMLCFSHDWNSDPLSKTHLMRHFAKNNRVLWVNSVGYRTPAATRSDLARAWTKLKAAAGPIANPLPNLHVLNTLAIPAWGSPAARGVNRRLLAWQVRRAMRRLGFNRVINWVFNPAAGVVAGELGEDGIVYYCVDEYAAFAGVDGAALAELELGLLRRADLVVVSAERLRAAKASHNPRTHLVRHGVDYEHFRRALDRDTEVPAELAALPRPVIGYFGLMAPDWLDVPLLASVARRFAHGSVVLLGKVGMDLGELAALANVHVLGRKPYATLPGYCKGFDVALIPFPINDVTLNANPLKAREYLAAGLPVVSTAIPEVEFLDACAIARDHDEFCAKIAAALEEPGPSAPRSLAMANEGWHARADEVARLYDACRPGRQP